MTFLKKDGSIIVDNMIAAIQENKQYLSDIDGAIGDGDHGINMNKGFTLCGEKLANAPGDLGYSLKILSRSLMEDVGGSMGPLYGMFFRAMSGVLKDKGIVDAAVFGEMLKSAKNIVMEIGGAGLGDKTMLDSLIPAAQAYDDAIAEGKSFYEALDILKKASQAGCESTKDMIAKVGRASRLGERSRGVIDAGAASCNILLTSMADSIQGLYVSEEEET